MARREGDHTRRSNLDGGADGLQQSDFHLRLRLRTHQSGVG